MSHHAVLIIAGDPLAAALLAAAAEQAGAVPHFPRERESAWAALRRLRPGLVVVSCDHPEACSDAFVGPALMTGARVLIVETPDISDEARALIERLDVPVIAPARDADSLTQYLGAESARSEG